ncbi:MAG: YceI family protein [Polyangiales bacterium]
MIRRTISAVSILTICMGVSAFAEADASKFEVKKGKATFVSDAPLETMEGTSDKVSGTLVFDPADLSTTRGTFRSPVVAMKTGNDLRDEHLQGDSWLDAKKNPNLIFEIVEVTGADSLKPKKNTKVKVKGKFTAHGVTKVVNANGTVKWTPSDDGKDALRIQAKFNAVLEDHDVSVPSIVRLKVANDISVSVDIEATRAGAAPQSASR